MGPAATCIPRCSQSAGLPQLLTCQHCLARLPLTPHYPSPTNKTFPQEVYLGGETSCDVQGLAPASELVFCVKALYDDAQFIWSEPLLVTTAAAAGKKKPAPASGSK